MTPKVSVLMPNYNCEKYIAEAIESILSQSFTDFEFIIIDDASTDTSWEIIQEYAKKDTRINAFRNIQNLGIAKIRNNLLSKAKGKYIIWQDSDDISLSYRIDRQFHFMENHPSVGICGGGLQFFNENGDTSKRLYDTTDDELRRKIFRQSPIAQPASIYLLEAVKNSGCYSENLDVAEDLDLSFRIGRFYKFANLKEVVLLYRQHNSVTFQKLRKMEFTTLKIRYDNHKAGYVTMTFTDKIYNCTQFLSIYLIPTKLKIALFNLIRNHH